MDIKIKCVNCNNYIDIDKLFENASPRILNYSDYRDMGVESEYYIVYPIPCDSCKHCDSVIVVDYYEYPKGVLNHLEIKKTNVVGLTKQNKEKLIKFIEDKIKEKYNLL